MFGKAKIQSYSVWKSQTREFHCLEKPKSRIPVFRKAKIQSSSVWKSQTQEFQCLEKQKSRIPMLRKAKIQNSNVCKNKIQNFIVLKKQKDQILSQQAMRPKIDQAIDSEATSKIKSNQLVKNIETKQLLLVTATLKSFFATKKPALFATSEP